MSLTTLLLIPPALWMGYTWGAHLLTLGAIRCGPRSGRRVALTFDDGPDLVHTPKLLDLLHEVGARGTFFLVGQRVSQARALVRRIAAEGHEVGNHTWSHRNLWTCGPRETEREIERGHRILEDVAERAPSWFRQPEGLRPVPPDRLTSHLLTHAHPGAIVDLHDAPGVRGAPERLLAALPSMLSGLRARGYELVPLGTLLSGA